MILLPFALWSLVTGGALAASLDFTEEERAYVADRADRPVLVGAEESYPPFVFQEDGRMRGLSVDVLDLVARMSGLSFAYSDPAPLSELLRKIREDGDIEVVTSLTSTREREEYLTFTKPYVRVPAVVVAPLGEGGYLSRPFEEIAAELPRIAVGKDFGVQAFLESNYPDVPLILEPDDEACLREVLSGGAELAVVDMASASWLIGRRQMFSLGIGPDVGFNYELGLALPKDGDPLLAAVLGKAIDAIDPGDADAVTHDWFGFPTARAGAYWFFHSIGFQWAAILSAATLGVLLLVIIWNWQLRRRVRAATASMRELQAALEQGVRERTRELDEVRSALAEQNRELEERLVDQERSQLAMLNVLEDVDEERNQIEELTRRLSLATSAAQMGIWEWNPSSGQVNWDATMATMFGYAADETATFDRWRVRVHPEDQEKTMRQLREITSKEGSMDFRYRIRLPDGQVRTIRSFGIPRGRRKENDGIWYVGVCQDITQEAIVDQQKTEFVSLASHQLKTPIGAISWDVEMLLDGDYGKITQKQRAVLKEMYVLSRRVNELVNGLLNVSRLDLGVFIVEPVPTDVAALCEEVLAEMKPRIEAKKHRVTTDIDAKLKAVSVDPKLMRIVFQNYLSNAIKYTQDKGKIGVTLKAETDGSVLFSVSNNGEPIPKNEQSHIFDKMYRASNAQKMDPDGNGLGLYLVKKILEESGGRAWFTSKTGEDTVFYASIPKTGMKPKKGTKTLS